MSCSYNRSLGSVQHVNQLRSIAARCWSGYVFVCASRQSRNSLSVIVYRLVISDLAMLTVLLHQRLFVFSALSLYRRPCTCWWAQLVTKRYFRTFNMSDQHAKDEKSEPANNLFYFLPRLLDNNLVIGLDWCDSWRGWSLLSSLLLMLDHDSRKAMAIVITEHMIQSDLIYYPQCFLFTKLHKNPTVLETTSIWKWINDPRNKAKKMKLSSTLSPSALTVQKIIAVAPGVLLERNKILRTWEETASVTELLTKLLSMSPNLRAPHNVDINPANVSNCFNNLIMHNGRITTNVDIFCNTD